MKDRKLVLKIFNHKGELIKRVWQKGSLLYVTLPKKVAQEE